MKKFEIKLSLNTAINLLKNSSFRDDANYNEILGKRVKELKDTPNIMISHRNCPFLFFYMKRGKTKILNNLYFKSKNEILKFLEEKIINNDYFWGNREIKKEERRKLFGKWWIEEVA